jgi:NADH dehydrogenase
MDTRHVVVIGAGFAGLHAVRALARDQRVRITLVDQHNYHLFQPLLYQVAIAGLEAPQVTFPVRAFLRRYRRARFLLGRVTHIDRAAQRVSVDNAALDYDYLIVSAGGRTVDFGIPGVAAHTVGLKSLRDAMTIRDRILSACEEAVHTPDAARRRALLTFVVIGGGPTGVELAGALGELRRHVIRRDFPELDLGEVRVVLVEAAPRVLTHLTPSSSDYAAWFLRSTGVELLTDTAVAEVTAHAVHTRDGQVIPTFNAIWSAGIGGVNVPGLPEPGRAGRIATTPSLHLPDDPRVYVVGDLNYLEDPATGRPLPQVAPLAIQQGIHAARNIRRDVHGQPLRPFRYLDKGNMVTLGRNHAVAERGRLRVRGWLAWVMWLVVHLIYLLGGRNRFMVLSNWAYSYFTYDYAVRTLHQRVEFPPDPPPPDAPNGGGANTPVRP